MTTRFAKAKKFAGLAVMATAVTAVGVGMGSGTAQAAPSHPCPHTPFICHQIQTQLQRIDNFNDFVRSPFGLGEGSRFDNGVDRFFGVH
jgi:hypothetical protein